MNAAGLAKTVLKMTSGLVILGTLAGCAGAGGSVAEAFNPYGADESNGLGERNTGALLGGGGFGGRGADEARKALENLASYRRTMAPQPVYPVIRPAEVRLMWIPDHLSLEGNLVPAHYYFLKVTNDDWEVQDAFEIEGQYDVRGGGADFGSGGATPAGGAGYGGATPWVYKEGK